MASGTPVHMLDGYKVLDFTRAVAGPTASLMLAEMGAEVIKVEPAPDGDPTRGVPVMKDGRSGYFVQHNRGKKSICVDVRQPEGLAMIKDLLPQIDVLVENFSPGVMARLGLDYETVKAINPANHNVLDLGVRAERTALARAGVRYFGRRLCGYRVDGR